MSHKPLESQFFDVERNGRKVRLPLSALTRDEVMCIANGLLRAGLPDQAQPLYRWQHAMGRRPPSEMPPSGGEAA